MQLQASLLFGRVREKAMSQERRRIAREVHDGVAQDVASLGYLVDNLAATSADPVQQEQIGQLRQEVTRVVSELRQSIFDLRHEIAAGAGLGESLSAYANQVSATSPMAVHVTLDEKGPRLSGDVEYELLRIAQEAMANARKHSGAANLWLRCTVRSPYAEIEVGDDGVNRHLPKADSQGLKIMRERSRSIGADLAVHEPTARTARDPRRRPRGLRRSTASLQKEAGTDARVPMTTVLLIDDHELIRQGLAGAFAQADGFEVAGQAGSVEEGIALAHEVSPDVVVTDVRLPDGSGLDVVRALRKESREVGLVVLTMYAGDEQLFAAMDAGASAFVGKDAPTSTVISAARQASVAPLTFTCTGLAEAMVRRISSGAPRLSDRERQVLDLLAEGLGVTAIAGRLYLSESTAKSHIGRIYDKLGAANRAQALVTAMRTGLIASATPPS